ncbi:MAG: response regulator, partial [candidate division Zixibacteria bacterium]|nr:response regulator [candidate division Zixibacteria bacterium]
DDPGRWVGTETVLLVEDEAEVRTLIRILLSLNGYTVLDAADPVEALSVCMKHTDPIHILVADIVMPHMSGIELSRQCRRLHPEIRTVYMTGYADRDLERYGIDEHTIPLLRKPFHASALMRAIRTELNPR